MPFRIQRVPRGLNDLLSIFGGGTPSELEDRVRATVELTQFYGLQQRQQVAVNDPALAQGATITLGGGGAAIAQFTTKWCILFAASASMVRTGTMTAARLSVILVRGGSTGITLAHDEGSPYAATALGTFAVPFVAPYPLLLPPPWNVGAFLASLGTDATASVTINAEIGVLQ